MGPALWSSGIRKVCSTLLTRWITRRSDRARGTALTFALRSRIRAREVPEIDPDLGLGPDPEAVGTPHLQDDGGLLLVLPRERLGVAVVAVIQGAGPGPTPVQKLMNAPDSDYSKQDRREERARQNFVCQFYIL
jgi:hypothetical protein